MSLFKKKDTVTIPFPTQEKSHSPDIKDNSASFKGEGKKDSSPEPAAPKPEGESITAEKAIEKMQYACARASEIAKHLCLPAAQGEFNACQMKMTEFLMWATEGHERNKMRMKMMADAEKNKPKEPK